MPSPFPPTALREGARGAGSDRPALTVRRSVAGGVDERGLELSAAGDRWSGTQHVLEQCLHFIEHGKGTILHDLRRLGVEPSIHLGNDVVVAGAILHIGPDNIKELLHACSRIAFHHNVLSRSNGALERRRKYIKSLIYHRF